ncbi:MAG: hypothetical protein IJX93_04720 [Clostridia bacterium]|nr:hypothetical protein [Clostridia bacterium]MBQ8370986.1 hypothetical protein [Clostridia bacterium]MBQ8511582.1 hypothetical protein [Clostridia bacterium]
MIRVAVNWQSPLSEENLARKLPSAVRQLESAVLASCEPFVPYKTGQLCRSGHASGSGTAGSVTWSAPHAAECYYANRSFNKKHHPHATARWFDAAKAADFESWRRTAAHAVADALRMGSPERRESR